MIKALSTEYRVQELCEALAASPSGYYEWAGRKPGKDILIVSVDGVKGAFEAMVEGKLNCTVECNPLIGGQLFDAVEAVMAKKTLPKRTVVQESVYEQSQAAEAIKTRKY